MSKCKINRKTNSVLSCTVFQCVHAVAGSRAVDAVASLFPTTVYDELHNSSGSIRDYSRPAMVKGSR